MTLTVPQVPDPLGTRCFLQPHDGPKVMVHCVERKGHPPSVPHTWEKAGYSPEGHYIPPRP